ncbi:SAM-dependent methyltransferase [Paraburkholderia sp. Ac-20340]|uniref:SAM-dependent methyltransferase n=1 Tax=Paraburkholderia sp. Ac-20340 TaxID=2703888 RepID=UPI00197DA328|nr:SAM-dependent methyltransferase [Paraburkholderia sp. Ac-20340]MBN3857208.1 SAM-dependent methyltransferase [Paraburkholderia sp. Ac-20340]
MTMEAARTAIGPMALVAVEQRLAPSRRIVHDELAESFLPTAARWFLSMTGARTATRMSAMAERHYPGLWGGLLCRKRYIDDKLSEALPQIDAFVNLGAGFDTRALRLLDDNRVPAWELDQRANIETRRARLKQRYGRVPANMTLVAIDFEHQALDAALAAQGYRRELRTFFVWEGVTQYLDEASVRATFAFLSRAKPGSRLAFTYICSDFLEGDVPPGMAPLYRRFVASRPVWRFGLDPQALRAFLAPYGWRAIEQLEPAALAQRYIEPTGRNLSCMPIERTVYAERV